MQLNPRFSQFSRGARLVALPAALAGCLLIASGASFATTGQTAAQTPPPQVAAAALPQAPEPFAPADIPLEADNTVQTLARIDTIVAADPQVTAIEVGLPGPEASIAADVAALEAIDPGTILQRTLEDLQQTWLVHQRNLLEPTTTVGNRYQQLQGELVILNDLDTRWQATLDNTQAQGELTEPLREIIGNQQAAIAATRGRLRPRIDVVLAFQTRLATLNNEVTEALDLIAVLRAEVRQRLFSRDAEPFWRSQRDVDVLLQQGRDAWEQRVNTVRTWVLTDFDRIVFHALVFAMFVAVGVAGRRKMRDWVDLQGAQGFLRLVDRPYSGAAIFSLLSSLWIYDTVPATVGDLMLLATLIPVMRLAPAFVAPENRVDIYGLLGLYAATRLAAIAPDGSVLRRTTFLIVAVVAFVGLVRFVRHRLAKFVQRGGGWMRFVAFITRLAVVILAFAIGGSLFGWTQLSEMLTSAVLSSGYAAVIVVLFASSAAAGIGHVLPHTLLGDKLP